MRKIIKPWRYAEAPVIRKQTSVFNAWRFFSVILCYKTWWAMYCRFRDL